MAATFMVAAALAGCSGNAEPTAETSPSEATAALATETPTQATSASPTSAVDGHKFAGTIDYEKLTNPNWTSLSDGEQQAVCSEFFAANIENEPVMTSTSTGVEVAQWYYNRLGVLQDLALDHTDERNYTAALNIADCLTFSQDATGEGDLYGREALKMEIDSLSKSSIDGLELSRIDPTKITRHSDGLFQAYTEQGFGYTAISVEGYLDNELGNTPYNLYMDYYQWVDDESVYRHVLTTFTESNGVNPYFGEVKPPIVLDPMRQSAPNARG